MADIRKKRSEQFYLVLFLAIFGIAPLGVTLVFSIFFVFAAADTTAPVLTVPFRLTGAAPNAKASGAPSWSPAPASWSTAMSN